MIKTITVTNPRGESTILDLANPWKNGFAVTEITGISPEKSNINTTDLSVADGSVYNSSRLPNRNIVFQIRLLGNDIEAIRHNLYKYFPIKQKVRLTFETDYRDVFIDGYVESNEVNIFSAEESSSISVICPDPFFKLSKAAEISCGRLDPMFEFPVEITGKSIIFGEYNDIYSGILDNEGSEPVGFTCDFHILDSVEIGNITIYHLETNSILAIDTSKIQAVLGEPLSRDDVIHLDTRRGQKSLKVVHGIVETNVLQIFDRNTNWMQLLPGRNSFTFSVAKNQDSVSIHLSSNLLIEGI